MLKNIFIQIYELICYPAKTWQKISEEEVIAHSLFFSKFLFPIMGLVALSCFIDMIGKEFNAELIERTLKISIIEFVKFFISFYLIVFVWIQLADRLSLPKNKEIIERFIGYSMSIYMMIEAIVNILPQGFSFLSYASLWIVYIVWVGTQKFLLIEVARQRIFTLCISILILMTPIVVAKIFYMIMPLTH